MLSRLLRSEKTTGKKEKGKKTDPLMFHTVQYTVHKYSRPHPWSWWKNEKVQKAICAGGKVPWNINPRVHTVCVRTPPAIKYKAKSIIFCFSEQKSGGWKWPTNNMRRGLIKTPVADRMGIQICPSRKSGVKIKVLQKFSVVSFEITSEARNLNATVTKEIV